MVGEDGYNCSFVVSSQPAIAGFEKRYSQYVQDSLVGSIPRR